MLSVVLAAMIAAAIGLWLFLQRNREKTAPAHLSVKTKDKEHVVKMAVLKAELTVSSDANVLEQCFRMAKHNMAHQSWLAGLTSEGRENYRQSAALLKAAVGPAAPISLPTTARSAFSPSELSGVDPIDRRIDEGFQQQLVRRRKIFEMAARSLRSEPEIRPFMEEALCKLGREDLWAEIQRNTLASK